MTKAYPLPAIALGVLALGNAAGDAHLESAMYVYTFAELCRRDLPAEQRALFFTELERAEKTLATTGVGEAGQAVAMASARDAAGSQLSSSVRVAEGAMNSAQGASWRGADFNQKASADVGVKCLGEQTAKRWQAARLQLYRLLAAEYGGDSDRTSQTNWTLKAVNGSSAAIVAEVRGDSAYRFRDAVFALEQIARQVDQDREFGAYILPDEKTVETVCLDASRQLRQVADQKHRAAIAAEKTAFERPLTEQEEGMAKAAASAEAAANAIMGIEVEDEDPMDTYYLGSRVSASQKKLREARDWNLAQYEDLSTSPSSQRALERGETMLARANEPGQGLEARDELYGYAQQYFRFGDFDDREADAAARQAAIQPALEAQRAQREQRREAELEQKAEAMQQAVDDMQKTEAEKKSFNEEADALEAELGF